MIQINITKEEIRQLASHQMAYKRGVTYYNGGRVEDISYSSQENTVYAIVTGSRDYLVDIILTKKGIVRDFECDCLAFSRYKGACKHIVAVLLSLYNNSLTKFLKPKEKVAGDELLTFFENRPTETFKEKLNLEIQIRVPYSYQFDPIELTLRIGIQRLYVIKDMGMFLEALKNGQPLEFGKQFTFEPYRQCFREEDRPLINLLMEMYEQYKVWNMLETPFSESKIFSKKNIPLTGYYLNEIFDKIGHKEFLLAIGSEPPQLTKVNREGVPIEFSLEEANQDIALKLDLQYIPQQLTPDGRYYIYRGMIYLATPNQWEFLPAILNAYNQNSTDTIVLPSTKREFFASEALPALKKVGQVEIAPELATKFVHEDLQAKIYLERGAENEISARLEFHYGDIIINPFATNDYRELESNEDYILIRNSEEEHTILNILERSEFSVQQGKIYLEDDRLIFRFIQDYLPLLQEKAEIYYSADFKLKIRSTLSFAGKVRVDEQLDLLEISFQYSDLEKEELEAIFQALKLKKKYYRLKDGSFLDLNQRELMTIADLLNGLEISSDELKNESIKLPKYRAMYVDNYLRQVDLPGIQRNKAFKDLVENILEPQDLEYEVPEPLENILRDYQKTGFKWLKTLAHYGFGGILADDMGLGKTLQVLAFILSEKDSNQKPTLVIAPSSLIYNWQEEAQRFAPQLRVLVVDGTPANRHSLIEDIANWDLIVSSYPLLRRDIELYAKIEFAYCFLDEAQHIKNPQSLNAKSVQQLKAKGNFALTGTPIENSLSELWSIFNFVLPGYLLTYSEFRKKYEIPIAKGEDPTPLQELSRHVSPFILRRLKKSVLFELPEKIETKITVQLTEEQKKIYLVYLNQAKKDIFREIETIGFEKSHIKILSILTRLRQICSHPALFLEEYQGKSGKLEMFKEILKDSIASGRRILVFSQFTSMLNIIQSYLLEENIDHFYLSGQTPSAKRMQMVNSFNSGTGQVFLISLKAGGSGLNLTGADMVIHFDPWWNPAVEEQATDRAHRIGQKNTVHVIKLVTQGTIEEKIYALQEKKKHLIQSVIKPGETFLTKLTEEELRSIFDI